MLCDHLEGWDGEGGRETQEGSDMGIYVYLYLIHFVIQQKVTHHCRVIILQQRCWKKKDIRIPLFTAALFTIAQIGK